MALDTAQQTLAAFKQYSNFLIILPENPSTDALASGLAILHVLEKRNKRAHIVCQNFEPSDRHAFLSRISDIGKDLNSLKKYTIEVDLTEKAIEEMNYDIGDKKLNIFITPSKGSFSQDDLKLITSDYEYDALITLDAPDLEHLGDVYGDNTEFFYQLPIINIDHKSWNEHYGQVNCIDVKATSVAEIVLSLLHLMGDDILNDDIATQLLSGIVSKTKSFQIPTITPKVLSLASDLIDHGARRGEIMKHLYQSKSLPMLKLWGRVLARLQSDSKARIAWSLLQRDDFVKSKTTESDLDGVIDELISLSPEAENIAVFFESSNNTVQALVHTPPHVNTRDLFAKLQSTNTRGFVMITFKDKTLREAENVVLDLLRDDKKEERVEIDMNQE